MQLLGTDTLLPYFLKISLAATARKQLWPYTQRQTSFASELTSDINTSIGQPALGVSQWDIFSCTMMISPLWVVLLGCIKTLDKCVYTYINNGSVEDGDTLICHRDSNLGQDHAELTVFVPSGITLANLLPFHQLLVIISLTLVQLMATPPWQHMQLSIAMC